MSETMMKELLSRLDAIGAKLGEGGVFAWEAMLRQQFWVNGVLLVMLSVFLSIMACVCYRLWRYAGSVVAAEKVKGYLAKDIDRQINAEAGSTAALVFGSICVAVATIVLFIGVAHMANPSYYALMDLTNLIGK